MCPRRGEHCKGKRSRAGQTPCAGRRGVNDSDLMGLPSDVVTSVWGQCTPVRERAHGLVVEAIRGGRGPEHCGLGEDAGGWCLPLCGADRSQGWWSAGALGGPRGSPRVSRSRSRSPAGSPDRRSSRTVRSAHTCWSPPSGTAGHHVPGSGGGQFAEGSASTIATIHGQVPVSRTARRSRISASRSPSRWAPWMNRIRSVAAASYARYPEAVRTGRAADRHARSSGWCPLSRLPPRPVVQPAFRAAVCPWWP